MSKYSLFWSVLHDPRTFKNDSNTGGNDDGGNDDNNTSSNTVGTLHQDENGDWYETVEIEGTNATGRNYGVDPQDNSQGPNLSNAVHSGGDDDNNATSVTVESGDTLSEIAESLDTSVGELMAANPGITNPNEIVVGQTINTTGVQTGVDTYEGMSADDFMTVSSDDDIMAEYDEYMAKLEAAGEADTSTLDEIAAADTTGVDVYEPTVDTAAAVTDYYTEGAGATGATQDVDYTETSSGEDFTAAAESDTADISGGTNYTTYFGETVEVRELPSGTKYYVDLSGNYVALAPEEDVTVDTFSDSETTTPVSDLYGFEDTILETGTGGISGIRTGDPMTPQLAAELGITYFEGDTIQSSDLIELSNLGFDVSQADLTQAEAEVPLDVDVTVATGDETAAGSGTVDQGVAEAVSQGASAASAVGASITPDRLEDITQYANSLGVYTEEDLDAAGFTAAEIAAFEQGVAPEGLSQADITALETEFGTLEEAPGTIEEASRAIEYIKGNPDLSLGEIAQGLGFDTVGGFLEELALRAEGTGAMADDALSILASFNADQYEVIDPNTGETVTVDLDQEVRPQTDISVVGDALQPVVALLDESSASVLASRPQDYLDTINAQMPDPNNEGYNMAGEPITPGLWMASVAAQELLGLGLDVATVIALGPVAGGAVAFQQGTAEAGQAAANETVTEMNALKNAGALDHLSDEEFNEAVDAASTQAFYTSGVAGGVVDTAVALTAGGFAPLAKALPTAVNSALTAAGVLGAEGVSGGLEQVGVNAAVIKALEEQGINPADYDKGYLDQVITAAIYEAVGGTGASAASMVGSAIQNLSADGAAATDFDASSEVTPFTETNTQGVNTIETQTVTDAGGQTYTVDTAVDANGQTSVTVTNDLTGASTTTNVNSGTMNSVNVGSGTSIIVDSSDTANSGSVNTTVLESGSSLTQTGVDGLTGDETTVTDLLGTEDAVVGGTDQNVTITNVGGVTTLTNEETGFTAVVGAGTDANLINATNAVQNSDADAAVAAGATVVDTTASETLLGAADATDETNVVQLFDSNKLYKVGGTHYVGNPANGVVAEGVIDGNLYSEGQLVVGMDGATAQTGTGGIGTLVTGGTDATTDATASTATDATTDATASTATDATTDATASTATDSNTTLTQNNDATVTTSNDGNVTVTTVTDANGNATVTTNNSVTGETTTDNVAVNTTATVTNGGVTVDVNAATDGTTTTTTESTVEGVVDVGTTAEAITQAATTTSVEEPEVEVEVQEPVVEEPVVEEPVVETQTSAVSSVSDGSQEEEPFGEAVPDYTPGIAGLGSGMRPVVAPYYQPQQTGLYNFYVPQPGVDQTVPAGPVFAEQPESYLAPTANPQYGYGYIAPNADLEYLRRLAAIQNTGAAKLPSEDLMDGS